VRSWQLLAALGSLALVLNAEAAPVRPGTLGALKDKMVVRSHVQEQKTRPRSFEPDTLRFFDIYFEDQHRQFLPEKYTYLVLADSAGVVAQVPVALVKTDDMSGYHFSCAERLTRMSSFHFDGPNDYYDMDLMYWDDVGSPFTAQFTLRQPTIRQGDVAIVDVVLSSIEDATLTFGDDCQIQYRMFNSIHEPVAAGPSDTCGDMLTTIRLKRGESRSFEMRCPSAVRASVPASQTELLAPGLYFVNCYVSGYGDLGLTAKLELTIQPQ
jgi:hypothetical protein